MKTLTRCTFDQTATKYGGWAGICDPRYKIPAELYREFEAAGLAIAELDEIKASQSMPARQRVMLDLAEDLLRMWSRHLCGFITGMKGKLTGRFVDVIDDDLLLPPIFSEADRSAIEEYQLTANELESFIEECLGQNQIQEISPYTASRKKRIGTLALYCRNFRPADPGGDADLGPALVPITPSPPNDGTSVALPLPEKETDQKGNN